MARGQSQHGHGSARGRQPEAGAAVVLLLLLLLAPALMLLLLLMLLCPSAISCSCRPHPLCEAHLRDGSETGKRLRRLSRLAINSSGNDIDIDCVTAQSVAAGNRSRPEIIRPLPTTAGPPR